MRLVRIGMNVIQFELDPSPLNSVFASLERANAALFQLRTRLWEVVTGHHNTLEVMSCAQKPFGTHSEPSEKVSSSSLVRRRRDHRPATLSPCYEISLFLERCAVTTVARDSCQQMA